LVAGGRHFADIDVDRRRLAKRGLNRRDDCGRREVWPGNNIVYNAVRNGFGGRNRRVDAGGSGVVVGDVKFEVRVVPVVKCVAKRDESTVEPERIEIVVAGALANEIDEITDQLALPKHNKTGALLCARTFNHVLHTKAGGRHMSRSLTV
jgi:hypothetical protein